MPYGFPILASPDDDTQNPAPPPMSALSPLGQKPPSAGLPPLKPPMPRSLLGTDVAPGAQISPEQMPQAEKLEANPKKASEFQAKQNRTNTLRDFGQKEADIMGQIISLDPHDPAYREKLGDLHTAQGSIKEEKAHFERENPWGSAGNHPGVFGKIGHALGEIGNVAGTALAPGVTAAIPGSQLNLAAKEHSGMAEEKFGSDMAGGAEKAESAAQVAQAREDAAKAQEELAQSKSETTDRLATLKEQTPAAQLGTVTAGGGTIADPKAQNAIAMNNALHPPKPVNMQAKPGTDGAGRPAEANFHPDTGAYTHPDGTPFPDFKPAPNATTQPQVPVVYRDPKDNKLHMEAVRQGGVVPENSVNAAGFGKDVSEDRAQSLGGIAPISRYRDTFHAARPALTTGDLEALKVLTSHAQGAMKSGIVEAAQTGILDSIVGEPMTGYSEKLMEGTMKSDMYNNLSPQGQQLFADYTHAIVANFVNLREKMKAIGRNESMIQAEINNIPVPYAPSNQAEVMLGNTLRDAQAGLSPIAPNAAPNAPAGNRRVVDLTH